MGYLNKDQGEEVAALRIGRGSVEKPALSFQRNDDTGFYLGDAGEPLLSIDGATVGSVVGTTGIQTLTNKTVNLASNTLTATSAQLATAITDETGSGLLVFATSPTLTTPLLGTPTSGVLTNCTGLPIAAGLAVGVSADLAGRISDETGTGLLVFATTPTLTTPVIGAATGTSLAATGAITSSGATAGIGYATGAGGAVTQGVGRTTGVTLNAISGAITTDTASLAAEADATFIVTNSAVAIGDVVVVSERSGSNGGMTSVEVGAVAAGSFSIDVVNNNAAAGVAETGAIIINFAVIKAVSA